jgi:predicted RNA-binding protein with RPS1 domain
VLLETGDATWALSAALPRRLDVYGGAARIWWPGLSTDSDPFDHPLLLIHDERDATLARQRILAAIVEGDAVAGRWGVWRPPEKHPPFRTGGPVRPARPARSTRTFGGDDPWQRIAEEYSIGEVVPGRVFRVEPTYVLVELLPGAGVMVPLSEIDYTWVRDANDMLKVGERVNVEILELDPSARRGLASIKRGLLATPREGVSLTPGESPYLGGEAVDESQVHLRSALRREGEALRQQTEELEAALDDRQRLAQHNADLKEQLAAARKELRSAEDRCRALQTQITGDLDPLSSENAFLAAVRVEHARRFDESDRFDYPLARMRVGRAFMESLRALEGIGVEKVVEVCAQVASGRAHEVPGRAVHELTEGSTGPEIIRSSDGAKAWRCALQVGSPSARRLHWWVIPGSSGPTIEFANVAIHDEFSIPV